jgi:hypothetical protein
MFDVALGGLFGMMGRLHMMSMRGVRMVRGLFVRAGLVMLRRFLVVSGRMLEMLSGFLVVFRSLL